MTQTLNTPTQGRNLYVSHSREERIHFYKVKKVEKIIREERSDFRLDSGYVERE